MKLRTWNIVIYLGFLLRMKDVSQAFRSTAVRVWDTKNGYLLLDSSHDLAALVLIPARVRVQKQARTVSRQRLNVLFMTHSEQKKQIISFKVILFLFHQSLVC